MDRKKTKFVPNWTLADLKIMIKWKAPKRPNIPTDREGLVRVWEEVKDLVPPTSKQWTEKRANDLAEFENNGRFTIERTYIMRRAEFRKKEMLSIQISSLQPRSALKVIGCAIQKLPQRDREELLNDWKDYSLDDEYSRSSVSSIRELDSESDSIDDAFVTPDDIDDAVLVSNVIDDVLVSDEDTDESENDSIGDLMIQNQRARKNFSLQSMNAMTWIQRARKNFSLQRMRAMTLKKSNHPQKSNQL